MKGEDFSRSLLIAVDGSPSSMQAVNYAFHMTRLLGETKYVLVNILPQVPPIYTSEARTDLQMHNKVKNIEMVNRGKGLAAIEVAKHALVKHHVDPQKIEIRLRPWISGLANDLLNEAELGSFDALIVGRRGLTRAQELFLGSVSNQLIQQAADVPLWINNGQAISTDILVAVDGSECSLRAVDHVAFILGGRTEARVNLIHVLPKFQSNSPADLDHYIEDMDTRSLFELEADFRRENRRQIEQFLSRALDMFEETGISRDRIKFEEKEINLGIARTIIRTAKDGGYGTVVLGRRGQGQSSILGSVSDRVIRRAANLAIWLIN